MKRTLILFLFCTTLIFSQKKVLDHSVYESWKILQRPLISNDGNYISYEINPQKGDGYLYVYDKLNNSLDSIPRGYGAVFTSDSKFLVFKVKPQEALVRKLKLNKTKNEDLPKDSLFILSLKTKEIRKYENLIDYKVPFENDALVAFLQTYKDTTKKSIKKDQTKFKDVKVNKLIIYDLQNDTNYSYTKINNFSIDKNGKIVVFSSFDKDSSSLFIFNFTDKKDNLIFNDYGLIKNIATSKLGERISFIHTNDTSVVKRHKLFEYYNQTNKVIIDTLLPDGNLNYELNPSKVPEYSENSQKLYFYIWEKQWPEPKDTLLDEEKYKVDIWNWKDDRLQTQQLNQLKNDKERSYLCVYDFVTNKYFQIEDTIILSAQRFSKGDKDFYLGITSKPYWKIFSWEQADYKDVYFIDLSTNSKQKILEKIEFNVSLSPNGNYFLYYDTKTQSYNIFNLKDKKSYTVLTSKPYPLYDEEFDLPKNPTPYGFADWDKNEEFVLIYDKFDIYKVSPNNSFKPINITNGRKEKITSRYIKVGDDEYINSDNIYVKSVTDDYITESFKLVNLTNGNKIKLYEAKASLSRIIKSKNSPNLLFTESNYQKFPDLLLTDTTFKVITKVSNTNPQMSEYWWGTVEIFKWKDKKGKEYKGLLYKPENFDPTKKYPAIVYYYEKYTQDIHRHYIPAPSRSVINFPLFNSNGYVIFIPDIAYKIGEPGKSATETVINGTKELIKLGFVDKDRIGLQGQSWGGYQTAYIVTQTDMFKAAMAGAPVSNMTSAYGGIRWESGMNRIFQYEQGQSRIGGTLWNKLNKYIENSPLFYADKVKTPLLIMANDNDGAVPYQEGIQYFVALRRLNKPVWLLNYNGDAHNLLKWPNRVDLSIRMSQFFDHFLKDQPAPVWMTEGVPAIKKGKVSGYDINK